MLFHCCSSFFFFFFHQIFVSLTAPFSYSAFFCLFFMHFLMLLFTSLCFSDSSGSNRFFLSSLLLSHRSRISAVTQGFFFWWCLPRISLAVSVIAVLKVVIIEVGEGLITDLFILLAMLSKFKLLQFISQDYLSLGYCRKAVGGKGYKGKQGVEAWFSKVYWCNCNFSTLKTKLAKKYEFHKLKSENLSCHHSTKIQQTTGSSGSLCCHHSTNISPMNIDT